MRTPAQLEAARRNGARPSGPKTAEGKARSSRNAITHGLRSEYLIVDGEVASGYYDLFDNLVAKFKPADEVEFSFIEQMAVAQWRQQRAWTIETATLNRQLQSPFQ
ncbi:MAG: hypothetical protein NTY38_01935, partial [Acidobacteria bacterium]|nr:hypothetical protein [Acidobacteriota bacterium]